jgi:hypothetical protein
MFIEIGGKPQAWCKICYNLTATGGLQLPHELPYDYHPGLYFPFALITVDFLIMVALGLY